MNPEELKNEMTKTFNLTQEKIQPINCTFGLNNSFQMNNFFSPPVNSIRELKSKDSEWPAFMDNVYNASDIKSLEVPLKIENPMVTKDNFGSQMRPSFLVSSKDKESKSHFFSEKHLQNNTVVF